MADNYENELDAMYQHLKGVAIPLMRQIDGPERAGMVTPADVDAVLSTLQALADVDAGKSHLGRALRDFLPTAREASLRDIRESGRLMIDGQDTRPDMPDSGASTGRQETSQ